MSVLLIPNPTKDTGLAVTRQAAAVLAGLGVPVLMPQPFANEFGSAGLTGVHFLPEADAYRAADQVVLLPIMGGREKDDGSVRSEDLAAKIPGSIVVDGLESAAEWVKKNAHKSDLVVCMSCGDLYKAADMMVEK